MVGTSSMAHGTARRVEGGLHASIRFPGLEVGTIGGGTTLPSARDWLAAIGCAGAGQGLPLRADRRRGRALSRDQRLGLDGDRRQRELLLRPPRTRRACVDRARLQLRRAGRRAVRAGLRPRGRVGAVLPHRAAATSARELLRDLEIPAPLPRRRPLGVARGVQRLRRREPRRSTCAASTRRAFRYDAELRIGTFESVW